MHVGDEEEKRRDDTQKMSHIRIILAELPVVECVLEPIAHTDVARAEQRKVVVPFHV